MPRRESRQGFSLLETVAAVVILVVVAAATVLTVAPMSHHGDTAMDRMSLQELATLNSLAHAYRAQHGAAVAGLETLRDAGYIATRTPREQARFRQLQSRYVFDPATGGFHVR
ncbi:prepilin-type N-terminal cleavage/methylation domain-containing protein [Roseimaritima sediminicola]|uniref:prepilin-type N-terminal cleavage/methylation domain-containing protein n=1 Tax=Roseimaritima sediminicola TaxID=2662066 RepID=UPI001298305C|nr:prepilin-type N-terminal cleavage/methylation domain-containing protein [Roseimaritima sediminicola]